MESFSLACTAALSMKESGRTTHMFQNVSSHSSRMNTCGRKSQKFSTSFPLRASTLSLRTIWIFSGSYSERKFQRDLPGICQPNKGAWNSVCFFELLYSFRRDQAKKMQQQSNGHDP